MDDVGAFRHLINRWAEETRQFCERLSALLDEHERLRQTERQTDLTRREVDRLRAAVRDLTAEQAAITATLQTLQRENEELHIDHEVLTALLRTQHEGAAPVAASAVRPPPTGQSRGPDSPPLEKASRLRFVDVLRASRAAG
jgi:septal ring factor EnvC (AmiA/AmiB activator)